LDQQAMHLRPGGHLIVLAPAHGWLFSRFDRSIGHFRRYSARQLGELTPAGLGLVRSHYLDSVGLLASAANRLALRQSLPTARQIRFWDRVLVPLSRVIDPITWHRVGKSVLCVWTRRS
jgi:hypothetical protein